MPNLIQIKFSSTTAAPPTLAQGEIAYSESSDTLFIGNSLGAVVPIGGDGAFTLDADLLTYAPLDSPGFTGTPTAPTPLPADDSTAIATTEWVVAHVAAGGGGLVTSVNGQIGDVVLDVGDIAGAAPIDAPTFTGIPSADTAAPGTSTTQLATTAFVLGQGFVAAIVTTPGTFTKVTIDAQGLVTSGALLIASDIPKTLDNTWITDFDPQVQTSRLDQMAAPTAAVMMNDQLLSGLAVPVASTDAANKGYVDGVAQGLDIKASCECASIGDLTLTGLQDVDGYTTVVGDRVLVKDQTDATQNGIYEAAVAAWTRAADFDGAFVTSGAYTFIANGTTNGASGWVLTTPDPIVVGTTTLTFAQFSGAGSYQASDAGIVLTGNVFSLVGVLDEVTITAAGIGVDAVYTQAMVDLINNPTDMTINGGTF